MFQLEIRYKQSRRLVISLGHGDVKRWGWCSAYGFDVIHEHIDQNNQVEWAKFVFGAFRRKV